MAINFDSLPISKPVGSLLPSGFAKATITKAEMKAPKNPGKDYLNLTLDCVCANGTKGKLWDILVDSDKSLAQYKLMRFITALKLNLVGDFELKDLCKIIVGKQLVVDIGIDEKGDRPRNVVEVFKNDIYYPINDWAALTGTGQAEPQPEISATDADDVPFTVGESQDIIGVDEY